MWTDTWTYTPFYPLYYVPAIYVVPHYHHHHWGWRW